MKCRLILLAVSLCVVQFCSASCADASNRTLSGSIKSLNLFFDDSLLNKRVFLSSEVVRLELGGSLTKDVHYEGAVEQRLLWESRSSSYSVRSSGVNRRLDLESFWNEEGSARLFVDVDRLNIYHQSDGFGWSLGRQAIGFGRISLFSPLDVIAPFPPDALNVDVRPGVDAVKFSRYFGLAGQFGGVVVFGDEKTHNSYLVTAGENVANVDLVMLAGRLRGRSMAGVGLAGEIGKVGVKIEVSHYHGRDLGSPAGDLKSRFSVAAAELWYRFDSGVTLIGQYLYNGFGSADPREYPSVAMSAPIREGLGTLLGRHYLLLGPSYQPHPLVELKGLLICNLKDDSFLVRPTMTLSLADSAELDLFITLTAGREGWRNPLGGGLVPRSEFGDRGSSGGLFLRYYF